MVDVSKFAEAYRLLGRPALVRANAFDFRTSAFNPEINSAAEKLITSNAGRFDEFLIDGVDVNPSDFNASSAWSTIEFSITDCP